MATSRTAVYRSALLACAALIALAAGLALAPPAGAEPPADLELILSLSNDADNVVPPDSTIIVSASLRHTGIGQNLEVSDGLLRIAGDYDFEGTGRGRVNIAEQQVGAAPWRGSSAEFGDRFGAFGGAILDNDTFFVKALESIFTTRWDTGPGKAYVYDVPTKTEIGIINPPAGASGTSFAEGFAAYQEDANTGWVFIGSWRDAATVPGATCYERTRWGVVHATWQISQTNTGTSCREVGRLYIYQVDRSASPMTVDSTPCATVTPSDLDAVFQRNSGDGSLGGQFGFSVVVNEATDTLVVGAPKMHLTGAARVFTKPSSAGGWCDLTYAAGVSLTPTPIPTDGGVWSSQATNLQKSYSGRHWSTDSAGSGFGQHIAISDDGGTIAFGAFLKAYDDNNAATPNGREDAGEVAVYIRPSGGWVADTSPNARLYVTPEVKSLRLGQYLAVSHDGATIAASAPQRPQNPPDWPGKVYLWNRPSGGWTTDITGPHATLTSAGARNGDLFGHIGVDFNHDSSRLVVSDHKYQDADREATDGTDRNSNAGFFGRAWLFSGTNGAWTSATTAAATEIVSPQPRAAARFGIARFASDGRQVIITQHESASASRTEVGPGAVWLFNENLEPIVFASSTCEIDSGIFLDDSSDDINTCALELPSDTEIVIPSGAAAGTFSVSGTVTVDGRAYFGSLDVRIGAVKEVAEVKLDFATDDRGTAGVRDDQPWPDAIAPGGSTVLQLSVLSETEQAAAAGSVHSIVLSTTVGALSTNINDAERAPAAFSTARRNQDGCLGSGGRACVVPTTRTALTSSNSDKILVTLTAPDDAEPGQAVVSARVRSADGGSFTKTLTVSITGGFHSLRIAEPSQSVLNVGTPDSGATRDNRDIAVLAVTAQDAAGNDILVPGTSAVRRGGARSIPTHRLMIKDPDGKSNPAGISARWLPNAAGTGLAVNLAGNPLIEIDVDAAVETPLANGEYTLEAYVNRQTWSRTFRVSGGPATLSLGQPQGSTAIGERVTLTATVLDGDGNAVPDGTPVDWLDASTSETVVMVQTSADLHTTNGLASASYLVIVRGSAYVRATAGEAGDIRLLTLGAAATTTAEMTIAETLPSNTRPNAFTTWPGEERIQASSLLPAVDGARSVLLWQNGRWLRYGVVDGQEIPGSMDFDIRTHAVLWLGR